MNAVDANVLLRYLLDDDPSQTPKAERLIGGGVFVADTTLLEVEWVLRGGYGMTAAQVSALLDAIVRLPSIEFADRAVIEEAVMLHANGHDFADAMHAATSFGHAKRLRTFDKAFVNRAKKTKPRITVEGV